MSYARGEYIGYGRDAILMSQEEIDLPRTQELTPEGLLLIRDGIMLMCEDKFTQEELGKIFRLHPESVGRILRKAPPRLAETANAILQGSIRPTR